MYQDVETKNRVLAVLGGLSAVLRKIRARAILAVPAFALAATLLASGVAEAGQVRALKIYHVHTHEKATIVFKRNGRYDVAGLKKLNMILRDWRRNEQTRMDPRLFDLIWEVYQKSGSRDYINIICGYRAPETNNMLRSRTRGVAEKSQHVLGKAMDFYIPDVPLKKLREIGVKFEVGGVGFYPTSGSPFVHMDIGGVRAWPRLPRRELSRLFPDGRTLHKPAEGGMMPGYAAALADYKRRVGGDSIMIAGNPSNNSDSDTGRRKSFLAALFSTGDENEEADTPEAVAVAEVKPDRRRKVRDEQPILTASAEMAVDGEQAKINVPVPLVRPAYSNDEEPGLETALLSNRKNSAEEAMNAALTPQPAEEIKAETADPEFADLSSYRVPVPELLGARKRPGDSQEETLTASIDPSDTALLASVPVPDLRPEEAVKTAPVDTAQKDDDIEVPAANVKPEEIAALAAETADSKGDLETDADETGNLISSLDAADSTDDTSNLAEMASLDMPSASATRSFVLPANVATELGEKTSVDHKVTKGGRPHGADVAKANDGSIRTEPKLTKNLIAQWALTKGRAETMVKPVKAPRFVSRTMRKQPTEVYADGFTLNTAQVDPARFSGTAVNFMAVKKFD